MTCWKDANRVLLLMSSNPIPRIPIELEATLEEYHQELLRFYYHHHLNRLPTTVNNWAQQRASQHALALIQQQRPTRSLSLANPTPATVNVAPLARSNSAAPTIARALPVPPSIPSPLPSFNLPDDDETPSKPAVPSFLFPDGGAPTLPPQPSYARPHPRNDPSHPSHPLYLPTPSSSLSTTTTSSQPDSLTICTKCNEIIIGRKWTVAKGNMNFHPSCFVCEIVGCEERLEFVEFGTGVLPNEEGEGSDKAEGGEGEEKVFCMVHYEEVRPPIPFPSRSFSFFAAVH